ncbi:DNA polymerase IV [Limnobacter parvus]|uniref:DNA polymerase IV n=1 Tax=Limnobacter parvus TaxID=2939690 RepID=A0ABT1XHU5_9BURK|nr:DNA polymerase IV [Limnobacter parvus]MCR2746461.1 DNA polymerase IV [Limnobacter parvus]
MFSVGAFLAGRIIAHLDMDAFYANAELVRNPALKGLPVAVGGRRGVQPLPGQQFPTLAQYQGRGVLTTANYEARALGLHSAMPTMKAAKLAPNAILLPADFEWYKTLSRQFKAAVGELAPNVEDRGIDEIYIDLTEETDGDFEAAIDLARRMKAAVTHATGGMTCSVGLSENKLTSKIASDLQKPNGLSVVRPAQFQEIIWPLRVGKINGVGPKAQEKLKLMGVQTIAELAAQPVDLLRERFGESYGLWMHESAHGIDRREVTLYSEPKSISRETTFEHDMHVRRHRDNLTQVLLQLADKLSQDLARKQRLAKTIGVKVRFSDFKSLTRDTTPGEFVANADEIVQAARACLKKVAFDEKGVHSTIRLLGIKASHLITPADAAIEQAARETRNAKGQAQLFLDLEDAP